MDTVRRNFGAARLRNRICVRGVDLSEAASLARAHLASLAALCISSSMTSKTTKSDLERSRQVVKRFEMADNNATSQEGQNASFEDEDDDIAALPWYLLSPNSSLVSVWDTICIVALVFTALATPFEVAFLSAPKRADEPLFIVNRIIDAIFVIDITANFFRVRADPTGEWEPRLPHLAWMYLKGWFAIDVVGVASSAFDVIPLVTGSASATPMTASLQPDAKSPLSSLRIVRALRLIKLVRLLGASRQLKYWQVRMGTPRATYTIVSTFCEVVVISHYCACVLGLMTIFSESQLDTWLATHGYCTPLPDVAGLEAECVGPGEIYLQCLWWGGGMLLGAPLFMSPPQGPYERYYSEHNLGGHLNGTDLTHTEQIIVIMLKTFVALLWATVIARLVGVYNTLDPESRDFRTGWDALNRYISYFRIDQQSAIGLRTFYLERAAVARQKSRARVVADFSPLLVEDFMWRYNKKWLERAPCFSLVLRSISMIGGSEQGHGQQFLVKISLAMTPAIFVPKERPPARHLYIIQRGTARHKGQLLRQGVTWGHDDVFLSGIPDARRARARASSHLHVLSLQAKDIEPLKDEFRGPYLLTKLWACIHAAASYLIELYRIDHRMLKMQVGTGAGKLSPVELERRLNFDQSDPRTLKTVLATCDSGALLKSADGLPVYKLFFNIIDLGSYQIVKERGINGLRRVVLAGAVDIHSPRESAQPALAAAESEDAGEATKVLTTQVTTLISQVSNLTALVEMLAESSKTTATAATGVGGFGGSIECVPYRTQLHGAEQGYTATQERSQAPREQSEARQTSRRAHMLPESPRAVVRL